jgi:hypothetical protein
MSFMQTVANRALTLCGSLYLPVGLFGFFAFGLATKGDVLNNLPDSDFYNAVRVAFTLAICIHYPVVHFGFRSAILTTWYMDQTVQQNRRRFWIITVTTVLASLLLAIVLPNLSTVFGLTGAVCAFPYCYMFPTLFYLRLHTPGSGVQFIGTAAASRPQLVHVAVVPSDEYQPMQTVAEPVQTYQAVAVAADGPLLAAMPALSKGQSIPAWTLFGVATILWIISIVVSSRDMVNCLAYGDGC